MGAVKRVVWLAFVLGLAAGGCGGGSGENDQGVSFRAVGIFQGELREGRCEVPTTENAIGDPAVEIALDDPDFDGGYPRSNAFLGFCRGFLELENNLFGQAINAERVDFEYEIPGAHIAIPPNSMPIGFRINPADADPEQDPSSFGQVNVVFFQLAGQIVPASLVFFLRQNRLSLPDLPYVMIVHITVVGRTDAGGALVTNETRYTVELIP